MPLATGKQIWLGVATTGGGGDPPGQPVSDRRAKSSIARSTSGNIRGRLLFRVCLVFIVVSPFSSKNGYHLPLMLIDLVPKILLGSDSRATFTLRFVATALPAAEIVTSISCGVG